MLSPPPIVEADPAARSLTWLRWLLLALLLVAFAAACYFQPRQVWHWLKGHQAALEASIQEHLALASLVMFAVYVVVTGLSLPFATMLTVAAGVLFGRWVGLLIVSFASTAGATLACLVCRFLLRDWVRQRLGSQLEVIDRGIEEAGAYYLLMLRLNPFIPYFLVNAGMGLTRIRIWIFWVVSQLGMLPLTFLYLSAAVELARLESPAQVLTPKPLIFLALVSLVPLLLRFLFRGRA